MKPLTVLPGGYLAHLLLFLPWKSSGEEMRVRALRLCASYGYKITTRDIIIIVNHLFILFTQ